MRGKNDTRTKIQNGQGHSFTGYRNRYFYSARHKQQLEFVRNHRVSRAHGSAVGKPKSIAARWEYEYARASAIISAAGITVVVNTYVQHLMR